jgi:Putative sensor
MTTTTVTRSTTSDDRGEDSRIPLHRNPLRLAFSASPWRSAWYLVSHLMAGTVLGTAAVLAVSAGATAAATVAGIPLLRPAAGAVRGCADAERRRRRAIWPEPVRGAYATDGGPGVVARALGRWRDPVLWRDLGYLAALWLPLALLDVAVLSVWAALLLGVTLPFWYWLPRGTELAGYVHGRPVHGVALGYFPHGPAGPGAIGLYADTLPRAMLAAVIFAGIWLVFNYLLVQAARAHAGLARAVLGPARPWA